MKYTSLFVAAAIVCVGPLLQAQTAPTPAQLAQADVQRYSMVLGLSSTEQEQALTIFTTEETATASIHTAERAAQATLLTAIEANDSSTIATLSATLGGLRGQEVQAHAAADAALYAILSTEQQAKFVQILEHGGGREEGPGGPGRR